MAKWLKTKDGKFAGSIGDGKTHTPTASPLRGLLTRLGRPAPADPVPDAWQAYQASQPSPADAYRTASRASDPSTGRFVDDFRAAQELRHAAEQHAATDVGQVDVLADAVTAAEAGDLRRANLLLDAAAAGRDTMTADGRGTGTWSVSALLPEPDDYDRAVTDIADFRRHASTPLTVPPWGEHPAQTLPHNASAAGDSLHAVADHVLSSTYESTTPQRRHDRPAKRDVYPPDLIETARSLSRTRVCATQPGDPDHLHNDYHQFVRNVEDAQRANKALVLSRARLLHRAADNVARHNTAPQTDPWA